MINNAKLNTGVIPPLAAQIMFGFGVVSLLILVFSVILVLPLLTFFGALSGGVLVGLSLTSSVTATYIAHILGAPIFFMLSLAIRKGKMWALLGTGIYVTFVLLVDAYSFIIASSTAIQFSTYAFLLVGVDVAVAALIIILAIHNRDYFSH